MGRTPTDSLEYQVDISILLKIKKELNTISNQIKEALVVKHLQLVQEVNKVAYLHH